MKIDFPEVSQIPALGRLWQQAFGDSDAFLDAFFSVGFSSRRSRCAEENGQLLGALYWFDCTLQGQKWAYLYGVATEKDHRGRGICCRLMEDTHGLLKAQGYDGCVLVPGSESLRTFYEKMGYRSFGGMDTVQAEAGKAVHIQKLTPEQFGLLRPLFLPEGGLSQEGMDFLGTQADFYTGEGFLTAVSREEPFFALELLGTAAAAPGILAALGREKGCFRVPGSTPFAMCRAFSPTEAPGYLGIAFD